ncbi:PREDICTED: coiled-coil domain-containing protein 61-like [Polistes canadensis]|uniref:coiled-coil domain-containing protein 61-like n=1 Tax=Polistes canadensis TaxID=91411 RepID=UPI000718E2AB|nr:PREDICTED: coiled-coil domain-containing protein 61-like [Polistes canadensis]
MNESGCNLLTTYAFKGGKEYVVKMKVMAFKRSQRCLELTITDKFTAEDWRSSYDTAYIENLTHKTGNYKQFDVFVAMLQSGLLKVTFTLWFYKSNLYSTSVIISNLQTSESITLDLLTFEDLELLRSRKIDSNSVSTISNKSNNRRYLILTYTVEFDRIHYPLPLEYCGLPDSTILQATIRRLQAEIEKLNSTGMNKDLQKRIETLSITNQRLLEENRKLSSGGKGIRRLASAISALENSVAKERASFRAQIQKLRAENAALSLKIRQLTESAIKRSRNNSPALKRRTPPPSSYSRHSINRRSRSRSPSIYGHFKTSSLSPGSSMESFQTKTSSNRNITKSRYISSKESKIDFGNLESRIYTLQKMLKEGINLS